MPKFDINDKNLNINKCFIFIKKINSYKSIKRHLERHYSFIENKKVAFDTKFIPREIMKFLLETTDLQPPQILIDTLFNDKDEIKTIKKTVRTGLNKLIFDVALELYKENGRFPSSREVRNELKKYVGQGIIEYIDEKVIEWKCPTSLETTPQKRGTFNSLLTRIKKEILKYPL